MTQTLGHGTCSFCLFCHVLLVIPSLVKMSQNVDHILCILSWPYKDINLGWIWNFLMMGFFAVLAIPPVVPDRSQASLSFISAIRQHPFLLY